MPNFYAVQGKHFMVLMKSLKVYIRAAKKRLFGTPEKHRGDNFIV